MRYAFLCLIFNISNVLAFLQFLNKPPSRHVIRKQMMVDPVVSRSSFLSGLIAAPMVLASTNNNSNTTSALQESLSGFVAGGSLTVTKTLVKYPLDTATVRLQMPNSNIQSMFQLFENAYAGIGVPLLANIPAGSVFFAVKDASQTILQQYFGRTTSTMGAVALAQIPYWAVRNPPEVVKTRQQAQLAGYSNITTIEAYQKVFRDGGMGDFYTGYRENIAYAIPADVVKFVAYDAWKGGRNGISPVQGALAGAAATALAQGLTTPLDVVRNRIMTSNDTNSNFSIPRYAQALVQLGRDEGYRGLFAGVVPRISKAAVSGAIQFATYEETKKQVASYLNPNQGK